MTPPVLAVEGLEVDLVSENITTRLLDGVSLAIEEQETLGLVGETGCGKSLTARAVMRLLDKGMRIAHGRVEFRGQNILGLSEADMRRIRGADISMIFQEPMTALDPCFTVGSHLVDTLRAHQPITRKEALRKACFLLERVRMPDPERILRQYSFELSGGMNQRVLIAMAIACEPRLLIADEPTTALDVTVQREILDLIRDLQQTLETAVLFISHDLGVIAQVCRRVAVMYAGRIVETGPVEAVLEAPVHPYTQALRACVPTAGSRGQRLQMIPGELASPGADSACSFEPRCGHAFDRCRAERPILQLADGGQWAACHLVDAAIASRPGDIGIRTQARENVDG
jgi:oligopeptide/dipeptide ABC transporter ATP-binding protein